MKSILIGTLAAILATGAQSNEAERQLKAAINAELVNGDLKSAIKQYREIAAKYKNERAVAAMALVRMADAYQKIGDAESRKIYERVLREYGEQKEAVAVALVRLGKGPGSSGSRASFRQVWELPPTGTLSGAISRDGRYLVYVDWRQHGDLFLHDFSSDTNRRLTDAATDGLPGAKVDQFAVEASLSRDSRHMAYNWYRGDHSRTELRLIDIKGDGIPQSRLVFDNQDVEWIDPGDWSPDGKSIAVMLHRTDKTGQIGLISLSDGALRVLKSVDWRGAQTLSFSPDGKYLAYDIPGDDNTEQRDIFVLATDGSSEVPAVASPSQDTVVGWSDDGKRLLFASDRSGSAALWSLAFVNGKVDGPPELLRRDIGQFWRLSFAEGKLYGMVHIQNAGGSISGDVYTAAVDFATRKLLSPASLAVQTYVGNNDFPTWSPDGKYLAYASRRGSPGPAYFIIAIRSLETGEVRDISPAPGLKLLYTLAWAPDGRSLLAMGGDTKGRYGIFSVDAQTGRTSTLLTKDERDGHPAPAGISSDGKKLYYAKRHYAGGERGDSVWIEKDLTTGTEKELLRTPKWGFGLLSPDGRYLAIDGLDPAKPTGLSIIPIAGGEPRKLAEGPDVLRGIDWAADSSAVYRRKGGEFWRLPIDGSEPRKVDLKLEGNGLNIVAFGIHPDGQRVAFQTRPAPKPAEVWVLDNFLPRLTAGK